MKVLVINSGSASLKLDVLEVSEPDAPVQARSLARGHIERFGPGATVSRRRGGEPPFVEQKAVADHRAGVERFLEWLSRAVPGEAAVEAVGHRVVHGGTRLQAATLLREEVLKDRPRRNHFRSVGHPLGRSRAHPHAFAVSLECASPCCPGSASLPPMLLDTLMLLGGLALIIKGGEFFVAAAVRIAEFLRMPRVVIGSTLVSLTTTTPELVVSIMAGVRGESGLAVGNAVGSCICNIGLILGVTAGIKQVDVHFRALRTPLLAMLGFGVLLCLMTLDLSLARWQGGLLLAAGLGYFAWDFWQHWRDRKPEDIAEATAIEAEKAAARWTWVQTKAGAVAQFLFGAGIVVAGSRLLVEGAVGAAARLGVPSIVIGLTVVAVGTSLPELVTAVTSARKSVSDLAVGNVLGANIANLSLIAGAAAVIQTVGMDRMTQLFNFPAMLAVMGLLCWMLRTDRRVSRGEGFTLLAAYAGYLAALVGLTLMASQ